MNLFYSPESGLHICFILKQMQVDIQIHLSTCNNVIQDCVMCNSVFSGCSTLARFERKPHMCLSWHADHTHLAWLALCQDFKDALYQIAGCQRQDNYILWILIKDNVLLDSSIYLDRWLLVSWSWKAFPAYERCKIFATHSTGYCIVQHKFYSSIKNFHKCELPLLSCSIPTWKKCQTL